MADRPQILIVDNNPEELMQLIAYMEQDYDLVETLNGDECLNRIAELHPDLILVDDMIVEPNCFDVCQKLKADPSTDEIPIILMSDLTKEELEAEADSLGSDDYICKPLQKAELLDKVSTLLSFSRA